MNAMLAPVQNVVDIFVDGVYKPATNPHTKPHPREPHTLTGKSPITLLSVKLSLNSVKE